MADQGKNAPYLPTKQEMKLLETLMDPQNRMKGVLEICKTAGIAKDTYYRAFAKPDFAELYRTQSLNIIRRNVMPIVNAMVKEAKRGSAQHQKMSLEMIGEYSEQHVVTTETYAERIKRLRGQSSK